MGLYSICLWGVFLNRFMLLCVVRRGAAACELGVAGAFLPETSRCPLLVPPHSYFLKRAFAFLTGRLRAVWGG